jgi:hypothetical protein
MEGTVLVTYRSPFAVRKCIQMVGAMAADAPGIGPCVVGHNPRVCLLIEGNYQAIIDQFLTVLLEVLDLHLAQTVCNSLCEYTAYKSEYRPVRMRNNRMRAKQVPISRGEHQSNAHHWVFGRQLV